MAIKVLINRWLLHHEAVITLAELITSNPNPFPQLSNKAENCTSTAPSPHTTHRRKMVVLFKKDSCRSTKNAYLKKKEQK